MARGRVGCESGVVAAGVCVRCCSATPAKAGSAAPRGVWEGEVAPRWWALCHREKLVRLHEHMEP